MNFRNLFERKKPKTTPEKGVEEEQQLRVGDVVQHPFRDEPVAIQYIGTKIHTFIVQAYKDKFVTTGKREGAYDVIDGSPSCIQLQNDTRFALVQTKEGEPCAEIDLSSDIEERTLVVPLSKLKRA